MRRRATVALNLLFALMIALGLMLGTAVAAMACSCVPPQPMEAYAGDPEQVVFTGIAGPPDERGIPVTVTHWFQGPDPSATVWLAKDGFGADGASCGTNVPPAGTEWIFVAYRTDGPDLGVNLCTPHAAASSPEGQSMYADAVAVFGPGGQIVTPTEPPTVPDAPAAPVPPFPAIALAVGIIAGLVLIAGLGIWSARRRGKGDLT